MRMRMITLTLLVAATASCTNSSVTSDVPPSAAVADASRVELADTRLLFASTRDDPAGDLLNATEIYSMRGDGTDPVRLTNNDFANFFASLSPDGTKILFESNRLRSGDEPRNVSDLFLMNRDGSEQTHLIRGASGTWSPDGASVAFHSSASGKGRPISSFPGAATVDSDLFVLNLEEFSKGVPPRNVTRSPDAIDDDPDWSPDGRTIVFTSHPLDDDPIDAVSAEIYLIDVAGNGPATRLTTNEEEERGPAWSPDGKKIVFSCRRGGADFEICVMNADGSQQVALTNNDKADLTSAWSPDGKKIVFHRAVAGRATLQLMLMNADGTGEIQWTHAPGQNAFPTWSAAGRAR